MPPAMTKRDKVLLGLTGIAVIFFIIVDPYYFIWKSPPEPETPGGANPDSIKVAVAGKSTVAAIAQPARKRVQLEEWGRDPFVQEQQHLDFVKTASDLKLTGISLRGRDRYALINSKIVKVGDEIGNMIVAAIKEDRVILKKNGRDFIIQLEN